MTDHTVTERGRPLLRWAGSKRKLLPLLIETAPTDFKRYIEPFAGSACLFFALKPERAVLGDINSDLMAVYDVVRHHPKLVRRMICAYPKTKRYYYRLRRNPFADRSAIERAARFIYLNRFCFNGVFRTNRLGQFNVPRGRKTGRLPTELDFWRCSKALKNADLRPTDFVKCLRDARKGDFVYLDPPYALRTRRNRGEYGYNSFGSTDLLRLIDCLRRLDKKGVRFLLSFAYSSRLLNVSSKWKNLKIRVRRHVAGFGKHRKIVREVLIFNYEKNREGI